MSEFVRFPEEGADGNTWAQYLIPNVADVIGQYSAELIDDSGDLKITEGRIGVNDNTNQGVCLIDAETAIDITGVSAGNWAQIEVEVVGITLVFTALDISGATNEKTIPVGFTSSYNGIKGGFYIDPTKRTIGVMWKSAGGVLKGIVNCSSNVNGYYGSLELASGENWIYKKDRGVSSQNYEQIEKYSTFASGTGTSYTTLSTWEALVLNIDELTDIPNISRTSNKIELPPGEYFINAYVLIKDIPAVSVYNLGVRIRDTTNNITMIKGIGGRTANPGNFYGMMNITANGLISVTTTLEIEFQIYHDFTVIVASFLGTPNDTINTRVSIKRVS